MKRIILLAFSIAIFSCGNVTLETEPLVIESVEDGRVMSVGDIFNISIDKRSGSSYVNPTRSKVYISPVENGSRAALNTDPIELDIDLNSNPNPQFRITDGFEEGLYSLKIEVYEGDELISTKKVEFVVSSEPIEVYVSAYHPSKGLYPESKVILKSRINKSSALNPYLIWRYGGVIVGEGYLSDGHDELIWDSDDHIGFNDIRLDVYPYRLSNREILSDYNTEFSILVNPEYKQLYPESILENYSKLLFFNGNYIDEKNKDLKVLDAGFISPVLNGEFYGLRIDENNNFSTKDSLFSTDLSGFNNFSIIVDVLFEKGSEEPFLFNKHGNLEFKLIYNDGKLYAHFSSEDSVVKNITVGSVKAEIPVRSTISFVRTGLGFNLFFYLDGVLYKTESLVLGDQLLEEFSSSDKVFKLGGGSSVFSEVKVYSGNFFNTIYPDNLKDIILLSGSGDGIFLEGFNTLKLPSELSGSGSVDGEILNMGRGASILYQNILPVDGDYNIYIEALDDSTYSLMLFGAGSEVVLNATGNITLKKRGVELFYNGEKVQVNNNSFASLKLTTNTGARLDSIIVTSRDKQFETSI